MSYLEKNFKKGVTYFYFVKKFSMMGKNFALKKYVGREYLASIETFMIKNMDLLVEKELLLRKPLWKNLTNFVYDSEIVERVEKKAILLNNIIEAKSLEKIFHEEFAKEFIFNSNNIEGSKIPKEKLLELFETGSTSYENKNEILEIKNSIKAFEYLKKDFYFSIKNIKKLYYILTKNLLQENGSLYPKGFKQIQIVVGNESTFEPNEVEPGLKNLLVWNKLNEKKVYPLKRAFEFHSRYETIHPFVNANGRTGRFFMNKILLQNNYPPIIIFKENKKAYFNAIKAMRNGKDKKYFQFMLEQTDKTYDFMLKKIKNF